MDATENKTTESKEALFTLIVSKDKMQVLFSCGPEFVTNDQVLELITARLEEMHIVGDPDLSKIEGALQEPAADEETPIEIVILEGQSPTSPVDAKLEWTGDYFNKGFRVDPENKRIDFHEKCRECTVEKDQLLAKVTPGIPGQDGVNVLGHTITAVRPKDITMKSGPNVYWDIKANGFRARRSGRIRLKGQALDVDEVMTVKSGVGTESGNIHHNGKVIINGDVEVNYSVEADGDISISGVVYASDIKAGGNLVAKGGLNGDANRKINVGGDIAAKYIANASVDSTGNILVNNEIVQCEISTTGEIDSPGARIIGGSVLATRGISVGEAGSEGNTPTLLIAGINRKLQTELKANSKEIHRLKDMIKKLNEVYQRLQKNIQLLDHNQKEKLTEIQFKTIEGEEEIKRLEEVNKTVYAQIIENSKVQICIHDLVHPGVTLRIGDQHYVVESALAGPIIASLDRTKHEIVLSSELET